jgi:hypothetical protein
MDEEKSFGIKVVGRKGNPKVDAEAIDPMQRMVNELRKGRPFVPKGVFRFKSFEEADKWLLEMQTRPANPEIQR